MKISTFVFSFVGLLFFYISNADWIDDLYDKIIDDYLGCDYEEVAPFISSVTAGTAEFDNLVEELGKTQRKWYVPYFTVVYALAVLTSTFLLYRYLYLWKGKEFLKTSVEFFYNRFHFRMSGISQEKVQNFKPEHLEKKSKHEGVPVKLLWKGGTLLESSIHCNLRNNEDSKLQRYVDGRPLKPKKPGGDEKSQEPSLSSTDLTARKMAEIRRLLESETELGRRFVDKGAGTDEAVETEWGSNRKVVSKETAKPSLWTKRYEIPEEDRMLAISERIRKLSEDYYDERKGIKIGEEMEAWERDSSDVEGTIDKRIMNRIKVLENRLKLEEQKNKNWVSRMTKAEGILQQLNKQVERIEEARPLETLTETLQVTSTVTNWGASASPQRPRRNIQFTLIDQYPPLHLPTRYTSLSEVIQKEFQISLPSPPESNRSIQQCLPPTLPIPALPSPSTLPQPYFLSKFLHR